jgi:hypothetical protein
MERGFCTGRAALQDKTSFLPLPLFANVGQRLRPSDDE